MPRDSGGTYTRAVEDYLAGTVIEASTVNSEINDLAQAISQTLDRAGNVRAVRRIPFAEGMQVSDIQGLPDTRLTADTDIAGRIILRNGSAEATLDFNHAASYVYELPTDGGQLQLTGQAPVTEAFMPSGTKLLFGATPPTGWTLEDIAATGLAVRIGGSAVTPGTLNSIADRGFTEVFAAPSAAVPSTVSVALSDHDHPYQVGIQTIRYNGGTDTLRAWVGASGALSEEYNTGDPYTGTLANQVDPPTEHAHVLNLRMNYYRMVVAVKD